MMNLFLCNEILKVSAFVETKVDATIQISIFGVLA